MLDHETFEVKGRWEQDRGPQYLAYDFSWHLGQDTMITSEWGTPNMVKDGVNPELLLARQVRPQAPRLGPAEAHATSRSSTSAPSSRWCSSCGPRTTRRRAYGFVGVVISLEDLSSSIFLWYLDRTDGNGKGEWKTKKVITIPAVPADEADLPPLLKGFKAVPPLVTRHQPVGRRPLPLRVVLGNGRAPAVRRDRPVQPGAHRQREARRHRARAARTRAHPDQPLNGGPQMVEVSRDGRRVYLTNSLYTPWDAQFYPDGIRGWMAKLDAAPQGGLAADPRFLVEFEDGLRPHQVRLQGGDASSDSFCYA